jgi:SAM-dependent methyltransferase
VLNKDTYIHTEEIHNTIAAKEVLPVLLNWFKPQSIVDVGCGTGMWLRVAEDLGVKEILGLDGGHVNKDLLKIKESQFQAQDLREKFILSKKFDLALSLEVAEHLPEEAAEDFIASVCNLSDTIIFSAAIPGQGGQNHLNEQWPEYWLTKFAKNGFLSYDVLRPLFWDNDKVDFWYRQNMVVLSRSTLEGLTKQSSSHFQSYVHPALYHKKLEEIKNVSAMLQRQNERNALSLIKEGLKKMFKLR